MELKLRNFKSKPVSKLLNLHSVAFIKRLTVITSLYIACVVIALYIKGEILVIGFCNQSNEHPVSSQFQFSFFKAAILCQ